VATRKTCAAEKTTKSAEHSVGELAALTDGLPVAVDEADPFRHAPRITRA
jgi:hypothetical protein